MMYPEILRYEYENQKLINHFFNEFEKGCVGFFHLSKIVNPTIGEGLIIFAPQQKEFDAKRNKSIANHRFLDFLDEFKPVENEFEIKIFYVGSKIGEYKLNKKN